MIYFPGAATILKKRDTASALFIQYSERTVAPLVCFCVVLFFGR